MSDSMFFFFQIFALCGQGINPMVKFYRKHQYYLVFLLGGFSFIKDKIQKDIAFFVHTLILKKLI